MTIRCATTPRNAMTDAVVDLIDAGSGPGTVEIRTGSQPATGSDTATGTLLATVTLADPAFGASSSGTANATDPVAVTAVATGTAGWYRVRDSNGASVFDGAITATGGGGDMTVANTSIVTAQPVDITSFSVTAPA